MKIQDISFPTTKTDRKKLFQIFHTSCLNLMVLYSH